MSELKHSQREGVKSENTRECSRGERVSELKHSQTEDVKCRQSWRPAVQEKGTRAQRRYKANVRKVVILGEKSMMMR